MTESHLRLHACPYHIEDPPEALTGNEGQQMVAVSSWLSTLVQGKAVSRSLEDGTPHLSRGRVADGAIVMQALQRGMQGTVSGGEPSQPYARHAKRLAHAGQRDAALVAVGRRRQSRRRIPLQKPAHAHLRFKSECE